MYPNKGEVWVLYKGWSMQWSSVADNNRSYQYQVVDDPGMGSLEIPTGENLRFSHGIPSFRLTEESSGKFRGFY